MTSDRPNVLVLMSDEHNHRFAGYMDDSSAEPVVTPTLDMIADRGTTFTDAYCPMPLCAPSRKCMLTGKEQLAADAWGNQSIMEPDHETLPETFAENGYETCLVGKMHFNGDRQFNGFRHRPYGDLTGHGIQQPSHQPDPIDPERLETKPRRQGIEIGTRLTGAGVTEIPESQLQEWIVVRESLSWLREHGSDQPWFLCSSFSRPHFPLTAPRRHFERYWDVEADEPTDRLTDPPVGADSDGAAHPYSERKAVSQQISDLDEYTTQRARAGYFACVDFLDELLGEFYRTLEADGFLDDTIIVYISDHGELAGEHGLWWKSSFHEASARIPFLIQTPAHRTGDRSAATIETSVSLLDLYPTLCGLSRQTPPTDLDGTDLSETVRTGTDPDRGPVFFDNLPTYRAVRDGRYKYVGFGDASDPELLFDLASDPFERSNLAADATGEERLTLERLRGLVEETVDFDAVEEAKRRNEERAESHRLGIPPGTGNAYIMPDGRLVDAGTALYNSDELAVDPSVVFADWPENDGSNDQ